MKFLIFIFAFSLIFAEEEINISIVPKEEQISDTETKLALAHLLLLNGSKKEEALIILQKLIKDSPDDLQLHYELALLYKAMERGSEEKIELEYIFLRDPNYKKKSAISEYIYIEEEPIYISKNIDRAYTSCDDMLLDLAASYYDNKKMEEAISAYKHLINRDKSPPLEALTKLGDIYIYMGEIGNALIYYKRALEEKPSSKKIQLKVAQLLGWSKDFEGSYEILSNLHESAPKDSIVVIEIARLYIAQNKYIEAKNILEKQLKRDPENISILLVLAEVEAIRGYQVKAKQIFSKISSNGTVKERLYQAHLMQIWGDFDKAEKIYEDVLAYDLSGKEEIEFKLAWLYVSTERYAKAEAIYKKFLVIDKYNKRAAYEFSKALFIQKNYKEVSLFLLDLLKKYPENSYDARELLAKTYLKLKKYEDAIAEYNKIKVKPYYETVANLGIGKAYLKQHKDRLAIVYFEKVLLKDRENIEAIFYLAVLGKRELNISALSASDVIKLGYLYLEEGAFSEASLLFEEAVKKDIDNDFAYFGLAESLSINHRYDEAINIINGLAVVFPDSYKIDLWRARTLGWSKRYKEAIDAYETLKEANHNNSILIREQARVAFWGSDIELSLQLYNSLLTPSLDSIFKKRVLNILSKESYPIFFKDLDSAASVYQGYEYIFDNFSKNKYVFPEEIYRDIENLFLEYIGVFRLQKAVYLERQSKKLIWEKRYAQSLNALEEVILFDKANEEARFDLAQSECTIGLCDRAQKTYRDLIDVDPLHNLAHIGYDRSIVVSRPSFTVHPKYFEEFGRGELDQIRRTEVNSSLNIPMFCRYNISASYDYYLENPTFNEESYLADGFTIESRNILSPYLSSSFSFCKKYYRDSFLRDTLTGHAFLGFNINDYLHLGLGYYREDELDNYFTLLQKTQMTNWLVSYESDISHRVNFKGDSRVVKYSDNNSGQYHRWDLSYTFSDMPVVFKTTLSGEYRDLQYENKYIYSDTGELLNIIYPYWTPQSYKAIKVIFDVRHDLSKYLMCGEAKHTYMLRIGFGTDTEKNDAFYAEGRWNYELNDRYVYGVHLLVHRSLLWNSAGGEFTFKVRF